MPIDQRFEKFAHDEPYVSLIVYQDGLTLYSRSVDAANPDGVVFSVNIGTAKVRSLMRSLLSLGALQLQDGTTPDPTLGVATTLSLMEPGTDAVAHTFSFGSADDPQVLALMNAFIARLDV